MENKTTKESTASNIFMLVAAVLIVIIIPFQINNDISTDRLEFAAEYVPFTQEQLAEL